MNPYLGVAATIASGLYGIENELELAPLTTGNGYEATGVEILPANLQDAANAMKDSEVANEILGETFVQHFEILGFGSGDNFRLPSPHGKLSVILRLFDV